MDAMERGREAQERQERLDVLGLPQTATYYRLALRQSATEAERLAIEQAVVRPDGQLQVIVPAFTVAIRWDWDAAYAVGIYCLDDAWAQTLAARTEAAIPVWSLGPDAEPFPFIFVRCTVRYGASPVYLESRWQLDGRWTEHESGLELPHLPLDRELAYQGLPLLREVSGGKEVGAGVPPADEFLRVLDEYAAWCRREYVAFALGRNAEKPGVLQKLGIDKSQFYDRWLPLYRVQGHAWARWLYLRNYYKRGAPFLSLLDEDRTNRDTPTGRRA